ncbi:OmpA family protein [Aliivibrio salmonicida]|uniref:OmpA family protein n=1 Tax=Aliivibrio salmonicida TaxID=40269 RepID=UPI003D0A7E54
MKKLIYPTLITSLFLTACVSGDKDYIETPTPSQIADLRDNDNDGVINARDICPGTPRGAQIDNDGCAEYVEQSDKKDLKILFANNSSEISPIFKSEIRTMAEFLAEYPETSIQLQGFASQQGNAEYNIRLSELRASAVRVALINYGVNPDKIETIGFGDTLLTAKGDSAVSHALNRRVVATVVGFKGDVVDEWNIFTRKKK